MLMHKNLLRTITRSSLRAGSVVCLLAAMISMMVLRSSVVTAQNNPGWKQENPAMNPPRRYEYAMSTCQNGNVLMFGGTTFEQGFTYLNDTWLWNGSNWTNLTPPPNRAPSPPVRGSASMAFDSLHTQVVLFGGQSFNFPFNLGDTWLFNGSTWRQVFPSNSPSGRFGAIMAFDEKSQRVILFGGQGGPNNTPLNDTWAWNGNTWTQLPASQAPHARILAPMAYFPPGGYSLVFGGYFGGTVLGDTPAFLSSSNQWLQLNSAGMSFLFDAAAAYYPISNKIVLFGGRSNNQFLGTNQTATWFFQWTNLGLLNPSPAPRSGARLAYNLNQGRLVLFGGLSGDNTFDLGDTWTWGKQVACLPDDGSTVSVGSTVRCFFTEDNGVHFGYWTADGFSPDSSTTLNKTFHTNGPGPASITANWFDSTGTAQSETFHFTIKHPHTEGDDN